MDESDYADVSGDIRDELRNGFERKDDDEKFATRTLAKSVLSDENLKRIYKSLKASGEPLQSTNPNTATSEDSFVKNINHKSLHVFLAVMIYAGCSQSALSDFAEEMVFGNASTPQQNHLHSTSDLPVGESFLHGLFTKKRDTRAFLQSQKYFCTLVIGFPLHIVLQEGDKSRMPWLSKSHVDDGSYGIVSKIEIAKGHFTTTNSLEGTTSEVQVIACKSYDTSGERGFDREFQVIEKIRESVLHHQNVLTSFGTLRVDGKDPKFSLFMPLAEMNLEHFMASDQSGAHPLNPDKRISLIESAKGLADGLDYLHENIKTTDKKLVCYHMDLKPANVLIFTEKGHQIWKISDFGMSKVKEVKEVRSQGEKDAAHDGRLIDFAKFFKKQPNAEGTARASKTAIARNIGTFLPFEAEEVGRTMNKESDIWSLGCIISLLFTYMEEGASGLERYAERRGKDGYSKNDVFYSSERGGRSVEINPGVKNQHKDLISKAGKSGSQEQEAVKHMLGFLETNVFLRDQSKRCAAKHLVSELGTTRDKYKDLTSPAKGKKRSRGPGFSRLPGGKGSSSETAVSQNFPSWRLAGFQIGRPKGCESSPNGEVISYWNDTSIMIYAMSSNGKPVLEPIDTEGRKPNDPSHSWKAVKLTDRYLIAITTGLKNNCYIFDIRLSKKLETYTVFSLPGSQTHHLDVSPDLKSFVCMRVNENKGLLFSATIEPQRGTSSRDSKQTANGQNMKEAGIELRDEKQILLQWLAVNILRIIPEHKNRICVAFSCQDDPLKLSVAMCCLDEPTRPPCADLIERNSDSIPTSLFTDITRVNNNVENKFKVFLVLQKERITEITFNHDKNLKISDKQPTRNFRILKIASDENSGRIIALGDRSRHGRVCLLEVKQGPTDTEIIEIEKLAVLEDLSKDDQLYLRIFPEGSESIALVLGVTSSGRNSVYQVNLSLLFQAQER